MFLAAFPYFQRRFHSSRWIATHFPSAIISVTTLTNLFGMFILTHLQRLASYPKRIVTSLLLNLIVFTLLALSAVFFRSVSAGVYFAFVMLAVFVSSVATALCQNGAFAYVGGYGVREYTQAIMTGQAIAGVLPCIAQIVSVLSINETKTDSGAGQESPKSAFAYFLTASGISMLTFGAFMVLIQTQQNKGTTVVEGIDRIAEDERTERKVVGLWTLFRKLRWLAMAVFVCFAVSIVFPVFTQKIQSVRPPDQAPPLLRPACFVPLAFLMWNAGDLAGRLLTLVPALAQAALHPRMLLTLSVFRIGFIPLYLLCNVQGHGAVVRSDVFYLVVVQFLFGLTSGYIGSTCMMGAEAWVEVEEREAAGGFMAFMLCCGLTTGSLLSFLIA